MKIGVLDIQGSVVEHVAMLKKIGARVVRVKSKKDLVHIDGLIIPGGESTTIGKLMKKYGLDAEIKKRVAKGTLAMWGTCAGAILLAQLGLIKIEVRRNAYGGQLESFEADISIPVLGEKPIRAPFIRAPQLEKISPRGEILAQYAGRPVMVRQGSLLATTFHPELTGDSRVHNYFLSLVKFYADKKSKKS